MNPSNRQPIIRMDGISKSFNGKSALENAVLELMEGEILGLVGDNGAGKSTLLKILSGFLRLDAGEIFFMGRKVRIESPKQSRSLAIEMLYQDLSLCGSLTVWENIFLGRYVTLSPKQRFIPILNKRRMSREAKEILRKMGIDLANINEPVRNLSGGEQQAVAISRCLLFQPRVILLDEPTASMAIWEQKKVLEMIRNLKREGRSIVMVTHNLQELFEVADRALVLKEGRSIWCGSLEDMKPDSLAQKMFLGKA